MKHIPEAIFEFYKSSNSLESFADDRVFSLNLYLNGNLYRLNSQVDNLTRSTVLYHPSILVDKKTRIKKMRCV